MGRLDGKVCFVTGAGSGIGAKTAELFAHEGASVIMADMHEENLNKVAANIRAAGGEVMTAVVNITDNDAVKAAFAAGVEKYGKIDALANIAGVLDVAMRPIDDFLTSDLDTTLTVNVKGTMYVTRAAVKQFIAQHSKEVYDRRAPFAPPKVMKLVALDRIKPSAAEVAANPRSRSAIMRVAERTEAA